MTSTYRLELSVEASRDIEAIYEYVANSSPNAAADLIQAIFEATEGLKTFPHRTKVFTRLNRERFPIRSLPARPYMVYFRIFEAAKRVVIIRVRHGARRPLKRFPRA